MENEEKINIQNLLNQVNQISKHYDRISSLTGENFNIFSIMSMERNEVYTHSAIITELLNPNGNHGQGDIFLKAFVDIINSKIERDKATHNKIPYLNNCQGLKEHTINEYLEMKPSGGRIDIYITNKKQSIIIENKIDAESQANQLLRYYNYAINKYKEEFWLIYLQKTENNHSEVDLNYSCGINDNQHNSKETKARIIKITYENEIIEWLRDCLKHTVNLPIIRETINQYIHLINKITNQSTNNKMEISLLSILEKSPENIDTIKLIYDSLGKDYNKLKERLVYNLLDKIKSKIQNSDLILEHSESLAFKESFFKVFKNHWKYCIYFQSSNGAFESIYLGVCVRENNTPENQNLMFNEKLKSFFPGNNNNTFWATYGYFKERENIAWSEFADDTAANKVFEKIISIVNVLESIPDIEL